jgi:hypothetical protein
MELGGIKIILILVAALFYVLFVRIMRTKFHRTSRVSQFRVGGRLRRSRDEDEEESREERQARKEVSLRDGRMWKRRLR